MTRTLASILACLLIWCPPLVTSAAAGQISGSALTAGGRVLLLRHALAPGGGDPANFQLDDCSTQRNLSEAGREQARQIGQWLRRQGVQQARIFSSQWCRCRDTATALDLGPVVPLPALNSFFQRPEAREPNLKALNHFLAGLPADGGLVILVTHFVTIAAVTGTSVSSGEGVLLQLRPSGGWDRIGRLAFGR
ncbi:MAG: histidine phosphatase family protein [Desulfosarcinaceae bacterium]|nr:histidine phosphatase family protein [Desulfosarcinaceae bacterium]